MTTDMPKTVHEGRNVKRIREILGIKQEALASELGLNQQKISLLEQRETIDPELLEEIAKVLKVPVEAIKNFSEEAAIFNIQHNYEGSNNQGTNLNYQCINPIEKWIEALEENKKLYERLLQTEKEKVEMLERILSERR